ncbi:MFS transporter [Wenjunlia tyrosinilytica]|uniref:MFS transporter n=1 Tax=Wenjunlia tyrosinilytica TaxID=1544741 RepID=A0A918E2G4_9ACTN|nr:MFS transporter [Wenjunlia tyrosinilytica]GGP00459.1 MFS transporter [Wenjunlia tyrosinilytica]
MTKPAWHASEANAQPAPARPPVPRPLIVLGFGLMAVSFMINAMDRQVFYPLLPEIAATYNFSLSEGGLLATGFTLGIAVAGIPAGYLVDRWSRRTVLILSIVIYSVGTLVTPLATAFGDLAVYRLISGCGEGMQAAALYAAISSFFLVRRSLALGALGVAFGAGVFFGPLIGTGLATSYGSWRAPFVFFGLLGLAIAAVMTFSLHKGLTEGTASGAGEVVAECEHLPDTPYNRNTILLAVASAAGGLVFYGFLGLYPTYLRETLHFSVGQGALATSLVGAGAAMSLPSGWLGDRFDQRKVLLVTFAGVSVSGLLLFAGPHTTQWQFVCAFLMGTFAAGSMFTNCNSMMQRSVRPRHVGRAAGLFVASYYSAASVSGFVFARLVTTLGWQHAALWQLTVLPAVVLVPVWFLDSKRTAP